MMQTENTVLDDPVLRKSQSRRPRRTVFAALTLLLVTAGVAVRMHQQFQKNDALIVAVQANDSAAVTAILRSGADPNTYIVDRKMPASPSDVLQWIIGTRNYTWHSWPLLNTAASFGNTQITEALLDRGANIDEPDHFGWTALMSAAEGGKDEVVRLLLQRRTAIDARNSYGSTALALARRNHHMETAQLLLRAGAHE